MSVASGEESEHVHHAVSGTIIQLAGAASQAAEIGMHLRARRAYEAEQVSRQAAEEVGERMRADRELASLVWARSRSRTWLRDAAPEELIEVWASARAWAPHDSRAARAVEAVTVQVADLGVNVDAASTALDSRDAQALAGLLADRPEPVTASATIGEQDVEAAALREERAAAVVREVWSPTTADAVIGGEAFGAFASKLDRLADAGHDVRDVLASIPEHDISSPQIRQPAAYAAWRLDQFTAADPARVAGEGFTAPANEAVTGTRAPGAVVRGAPATRTPSPSTRLPQNNQRER